MAWYNESSRPTHFSAIISYTKQADGPIRVSINAKLAPESAKPGHSPHLGAPDISAGEISLTWRNIFSKLHTYPIKKSTLLLAVVLLKFQIDWIRETPLCVYMRERVHAYVYNTSTLSAV